LARFWRDDFPVRRQFATAIVRTLLERSYACDGIAAGEARARSAIKFKSVGKALEDLVAAKLAMSRLAG
jgi:ornithine cyclodeaminase/alanine dehydrogenase-like protein (mu-crystallin family)